MGNQIERVTLKPLDRLRSEVGGLILMIGGSGENGQGVEVVTGKGSCHLPYGYPQRLPVSLSGHMAGVYQDNKIVVCGGLEKMLSTQRDVLSRNCWSFNSITNT